MRRGGPTRGPGGVGRPGSTLSSSRMDPPSGRRDRRGRRICVRPPSQVIGIIATVVKPCPRDRWLSSHRRRGTDLAGAVSMATRRRPCSIACAMTAEGQPVRITEVILSSRTAVRPIIKGNTEDVNHNHGPGYRVGVWAHASTCPYDIVHFLRNVKDLCTLSSRSIPDRSVQRSRWRRFAYFRRGGWNHRASVPECRNHEIIGWRRVLPATCEDYAGARQYDRAIADYTTAIELTPGYAEAYNDRGFAYYLKGDCERAIAD